MFPDLEELSEEIARSWCEQVKKAINNSSMFSVVLSRGNHDPKYGRLTESKCRDYISWESAYIFFTDERCVSPDDKESNYKMICSHLLEHVPIPKKNIYRIHGEGDSKKKSFRYVEEIQNYLRLRKKKGYVFDWTFLGVGPDGHIDYLLP